MERIKLFSPFLDRGLRFIVRLTGTRDLVFRGVRREAEELEYGFHRVKLPGRSEPLYLVVVRGFGEKSLMLLTNVEVKPSRTSLWHIVRGYLAR